MVKLEAHFHEDDLYYDEDVHVLPYRDDDSWRGTQELNRSCSSQPHIMDQIDERTLVIHSEREQAIEQLPSHGSASQMADLDTSQ